MREKIKLTITGLIIGFISGMFSAGGGLILVPALTYVFKLSEKQARATTLFCILPMCVTAAIVYNRNDFLDLELGIKCAIGGIIGGVFGSKILNKISNKWLELFFTLFLLFAGISLITR